MAKLTAVKVLEDSIADIKAGKWVCGELCQVDLHGAKKKSEAKLMACAVGLVSIFSGHTRRTQLTLRGRLVNFDTALYPESTDDKGNTINDAGRKALEYLYRSIPEGDRSYDYIEETDPSQLTINELSGFVVQHNDGPISTDEDPTKAAKVWFSAALKLAKKAEKKGLKA